MNSNILLGFGVLASLAISIHAADLTIDGFSGGELSFQDVHASGSYTIEWSSSLSQTNWSSDWNLLSQIAATGGTIRVRVPTFFRVRHNPETPAVAPVMTKSTPTQAAAARAPSVAAPPPAPASTAVEPAPAAPSIIIAASTPPGSTTLHDSGFGGGLGTPSDPYRLTNADQLQRIGNSLSSHYVLVNDIDVSETAGWDGGKGFRPIGNNETPFSGVFNGNGHRITGLRIARFGVVTSDIAFFGATSANALIVNVRIQDAVVAGCDFVGILVGRNSGTITNCHVAGVVSGSGTFGGLVGCNSQGGQIARCSATIGVRPLWVGNHLGGLAGGNQGIIRDCFAVGAVTGQEDPAGLVGVNNGGTIERCYAFTEVETSFSGYSENYHRGAGGLVALSQGGGVIRDCFAAGIVKGPANLPKGSLVGVLDTKAMVCNSFTVVSGADSCESIGKIFGDAGPVQCNPVAAITASLFTQENSPLKNWDFKNTWTLNSGSSSSAYPQLQ